MAELERPFGIWTATAMVVGGMIGAGIFVLPGALAPFGWAGAASWTEAGSPSSAAPQGSASAGQPSALKG